jgi:hypothetical protein
MFVRRVFFFINAAVVTANLDLFPHVYCILHRLLSRYQHSLNIPNSPAALLYHNLYSGWLPWDSYCLSFPTFISILITSSDINWSINPLQTKRRLFYLNTQFVPRCKHLSSRS